MSVFKKRPRVHAPLPDDNDDGCQDCDAPVTKRSLLLLEDVDAKVRRLRRQGIAFAEDGFFRRAVGAFAEALQVRPDDGPVLEMKAQAHLELGEFFDAVQAATAAAVALPGWFAAWLTLARAQLNLGEPGLALRSIERVRGWS